VLKLYTNTVTVRGCHCQSSSRSFYCNYVSHRSVAAVCYRQQTRTAQRTCDSAYSFFISIISKTALPVIARVPVFFHKTPKFIFEDAEYQAVSSCTRNRGGSIIFCLLFWWQWVTGDGAVRHAACRQLNLLAPWPPATLKFKGCFK